MIRYTARVLGTGSATSVRNLVFEDETYVAKWAEEIRQHVKDVAEGKESLGHAVMMNVDVELEGDNIHTTEVVDLFPSFMEWRCPACKGLLDRCNWCDDTGWDVAGAKKNEYGHYVRRIQIAPMTVLFVLVRDITWTEVE